MSNWCKNRLVITGQSVFVDELQQWVNGHVVPDYRHAIQQSCRLFLAGYDKTRRLRALPGFINAPGDRIASESGL